MGKTITPSVSWVGRVDWELRRFHGNEYSTNSGTTYNAFLVRDERVALIDTVWEPYAAPFLDALEQEVGLARIDLVISNHGESDHSGALPELLRRRPGLPVYCTANGARSLKGLYHQDWDFRTVRSGERLSLGARELLFLETPMLHWPDSMMCYLTGEQVLFSCDAFGQHLATERLFNDLVDERQLLAEAIKYYANILTPFSALVTRTLEQVTAVGLPISVICPGHGALWRTDPLQIVRRYAAWASAYQEDRILIVYDTMWDGTRRLAEAVARGIADAAPSTTVVLHNCAKGDKNDIITEAFRAKAVLFGSPTINRGILTSVAGLLEEMRGLQFKGKSAGAFGCYGWSGESVTLLSRAAEAAGFQMHGEGLKSLWDPDEQAIARAVEYGRGFARSVTSPSPGAPA